MQQSRRQFLQAAVLLAAPAIIPASVLGRDRPPPSGRITVGVVGLGSQGTTDLQAFLKEPSVQVVAACDVHDLHYRDRPWGQGPTFGLEPAVKRVENHYAADKASGKFKGCAAYADFRQLIGREDIDAVVVATPDHWHAIVSMEALRHGKDVYCEKPLTRYFAEGRAVCREVAKQKAVFQVGSQQRSDFKFRQAVELVRNGHLGRLKRVEVGLPQGYTQLMGDATVLPPPKGLDYETWCGPGPALPYMRARHHRWWRGHRGYGGGSMMDFIGHHNDIAHWALDLDQSGPLRVEAVGWTRLKTDIYNTPVDYEIRCEYPGQVEWLIGSKFKAGVKWVGENGWLHVTRGNIEGSDERWFASAFDRGPWKAYLSSNHAGNFVECVKSRKECIAPPETAHRSITPGHLGYLADELGHSVRWDAKKEEVIGDSEAQAKLMATSHRAPWKLG
ncbi:MAG: Gfo/Idh/MocA family oxidoreductase [Verrucomicrobia bacterium]|nr:Gfo/Idh/MocA family oxidoreductase [Verrucomicrobiota bacterium]